MFLSEYQIGQIFFINWGSYYKSEEILQIGAQQTSSSIERIHKSVYKMILDTTIDHGSIIARDWQLISFFKNIHGLAIMLIPREEIKKKTSFKST